MVKTKLERQSWRALVVLVCFFALGLALFLRTSFTKPTFKVVDVIDGDTIKLEDGTDVRYLGVDSPELKKGDTPADCFAQQAKEINQKLVLGKKIRVETDVNEMDRFGRTLAYVYLVSPKGEKEVFVNEYLLKEGAAIFFLDTVNKRYQQALIDAAETAHEAKIGLWSFCASNPELGCQIKGNLDKLDKRWYHLPSFRHYSQVEVNLDHGDRWFCTEEEAQKAGFVRARE
jgi:micrococcal nuclease